MSASRPPSILHLFLAGLSAVALLVIVLLLLASSGDFDVTLGSLQLRSSVQASVPENHHPDDRTSPERGPSDAAANDSDSSASSGPSPRRVVLVIGDGLGLGGLSAASLSIHGPRGGLAVESLGEIGLVRTTAADNLITDSAAAGTAMATGTKTNRGVVGHDPDGTLLRNLFEVAQEAGLATGAVTTSGLMDATPATFTVHAESRQQYAAILSKMLATPCEVLVGAHWDLLDDPSVSSALDRLRARGITIVNETDELESIASPFVGLFGPREGAEQSGGPPLDVSTRAALRVLSQDPEGFVLLVESEETDRLSHHNDSRGLVEAVRELDAAARVVLEFAANQRDTLVIITADHDTGGPALVGGSPDAFSQAEIRWLVDRHTAIWVPLFATGPGAERFTGVMDNTEIGLRIADLLGLERPGTPLAQTEN